MNRVIQAICDYYRIDESDIYEQSRNKEFVFYRNVFYFLSKMQNKYSYNHMTMFIHSRGGRLYNHATAIHGVKSIWYRILTEPKIKREIDDLQRILKNQIPNNLIMPDICLLSMCEKLI